LATYTSDVNIIAMFCAHRWPSATK